MNNAAIATQRVKFSPEEDSRLKDLVKKFGSNWKVISTQMGTRTPRQCRTRYQNYLAPGYFNGEWTREEDDLLTEKFAAFGSKWKEIKKFFPARTANALKNRWNYYISKKNPEIDVAARGEKAKAKAAAIAANIQFQQQNITGMSLSNSSSNGNLNGININSQTNVNSHNFYPQICQTSIPLNLSHNISQNISSNVSQSNGIASQSQQNVSQQQIPNFQSTEAKYQFNQNPSQNQYLAHQTPIVLQAPPPGYPSPYPCTYIQQPYYCI